MDRSPAEGQAEEAGGVPLPRQGDAAGRDPPKTVRPGRKRELVAQTCGEWSVSIRRACRVLEFDTSTYHYKSRRRDQAGIEARIRDICATRVRYGYRRVHVLLKREGWDVNVKRTYRIYRDLGLQLRNKTPKRRVKAKLRDDRQEAAGPNDVWAMELVALRPPSAPSTTSLPPATGSGCWPSSTPTRASRRCWTHA